MSKARENQPKGKDASSASDTCLYQELWWLILQTRRALRRLREKELAKYGLTPEESAVLFVIDASNQRATPSDIARWTVRAPHSISGLISRMEKNGLVERFSDLERKNLVRVAMTDKGREVYAQTIKTRDHAFRRVMDCLSDEECLAMRDYLQRVRDKAFKEYTEEYTSSFKPPYP